MSYIGNQPTTAAFVTDQFSGNGSTTAFTMSVAPATPSSVLIAISGVLQDPSTYSVSGTTLTFSAAPPSGTGNISARYLGIPASGVTTTAYRTVTTFTANAGQTTFTPPSYTAGFINVFRNGVFLTPTTDYTASNGTTVVLTSAATSGDTVIVESFLVSSVLNAIPATAGAVTDTYLMSGAVTQSKLGAGVAGNGPAFSAYASAAQTVTNSTFTKCTFDTEQFDTNNNFASSTFTPTVAGYYQVNFLITGVGTTTLTRLIGSLYKNGASIGRDVDLTVAAGTNPINGTGARIIYMNGSTDYLEVYGFITGTGTLTLSGSSANTSYFSASLVRSA